MKVWIVCGLLAAVLIYPDGDALYAQTIVEYGKGLGGVRPPSGGAIKGRSPSVRRGGTGNQGESAPLPPVTLPASLSVKEEGAYLYAQQDEYSARVESAQKGDLLTPIGQATTNGEKWYMARSRQGSVGWVKQAAVNEIAQAEKESSAKEARQVKKGR
jgi:hypothetical protein